MPKTGKASKHPHQQQCASPNYSRICLHSGPNSAYGNSTFPYILFTWMGSLINIALTSQDQKAALALVTTRPQNTATSASTTDATLNNDPDLKRAQDLLELHTDVKLAHADGTDRELIEAREAVQRVLRDL
jgi:hypothetical protein